MADDEALVLTEARGKTLLITLNRPDARNAVNRELAEALASALDGLDADPALAVGVLTGAGRGFSAGMDLKAFLSGGLPNVPGRGFAGLTESACRKPLIAAIEGFALAGGLEIALSCDLIVAAEGARLGIPEVGVGLFAGAGALLRLPRRVPYGVAVEMALTADPITAERGAEIGLVDRLAGPGEAVSVALELAERIARNAPLALAASKEILRETQGRTEAEFWELQRDHMRGVFASEDAKEGATAFAEKRAPNWQGK
ncbi:MAG TPA: crotonase/enoyl-CoA hydratase family protein [Acidimicrobiales bacterium]|jgi:enoyl-CoA hydratase/carnithine racemase|nr:crotonase/enoyl-CoA hydratase family protein [Acidimicrobiales bacterium]